MIVQKVPARLPDWRARLTVYLARVARQPFRPGRNDCALFAAGAVEAMTGLDLAADFRGRYRSLADGLLALAEAGYVDHVSFTAAHFSEVAPSLAQAGDLAILPSDRDPALGVIQGAHVYGLRPEGLALVSRLHVKKAFRV